MKNVKLIIKISKINYIINHKKLLYYYKIKYNCKLKIKKNKKYKK